MKRIDVICGIIIENGKVLVAQRSITMSLPLKWEFPGGKRIENETEEECLERELLEELNVRVKVVEKFCSIVHRYDNFEIELIAFFAKIELGTILTYEHSRVEWVSKTDLSTLDWAPADIPIVDELIRSSYL